MDAGTFLEQMIECKKEVSRELAEIRRTGRGPRGVSRIIDALWESMHEDIEELEAFMKDKEFLQAWEWSGDESPPGACSRALELFLNLSENTELESLEEVLRDEEELFRWMAADCSREETAYSLLRIADSQKKLRLMINGWIELSKL